MPREWSKFEDQSVLSLMAKGVHIYGRGKRKEDPGELQKNAYVDFATALNESLHGEDYSKDISKKEIARKIDQMLVEHKHVVGKGGLLERNRGGRITRSLTMAFQRKQGQDYDGSIGEWNNGRRGKVMGEYRKERGLTPLEAEAGQAPPDDGNDDSLFQQSIYKKPGINRWRSQKTQNPTHLGTGSSEGVAIAQLVPGETSNTIRDSYTTLPTNLRTSDKYGWANPDAAARRPDFYRPAGQRFTAYVSPQVHLGNGTATPLTRSMTTSGGEARTVPEAYNPRPRPPRVSKSTLGSNDSGYHSVDMGSLSTVIDPLAQTISSEIRRGAAEKSISADGGFVLSHGELEEGEELDEHSGTSREFRVQVMEGLEEITDRQYSKF